MDGERDVGQKLGHGKPLCRYPRQRCVSIEDGGLMMVVVTQTASDKQGPVCPASMRRRGNM